MANGTPLHSAAVICSWLAANYGNDNRQEPHVLLFLTMNEFYALPDAVRAHGEHRTMGSMPRVGIAAGILAKHALGLAIPPQDRGL